MPKIKLGKKIINSEKNDFYLIAEIGHNHMGNMKIAKEMIIKAKECGADAVKLQKRDNKTLYIKSFYNEPYNHKNSYGKTYGLHRDKLEFNKKQYRELIKLSNKIGIDFFATPFDYNSLIFLEDLNMPFYKIASADLKNLPFQEKIAKTKKPIILSTGGGDLKDVKLAVRNILKHNKKLSILQCTASYPANWSDMNLKVIETYKKNFPNHVIGLSDHEAGIEASTISFMLGARIFEKHFTLNRANKGTDHAFSLEPEGLRKIKRNLERIPILLGSKIKKRLNSEKKPLFKMEKSIVASKDLKKNQIVKKENILFKSPGGGIAPSELNKILGKRLNKNLKKDELILKKNIR